MLSITRAPMRLVPLPLWALACCTADAFTTVPQSARPHGAITISILPFFQRPSRLLRALAEAGAATTSRVAKLKKKCFIALPLAGVCGGNGALSLRPHE